MPWFPPLNDGKTVASAINLAKSQFSQPSDVSPTTGIASATVLTAAPEA
jgi:hypothetical protein